MATRTSVREQRDPHGLISVLTSAVLEWLLIFLLFLDALFSYLVRKFASFFELETPCLLCSRLDHIFGSEKPGFYRNLICHSHKLEISSLGYCRAHEKLANVHGMCEGCLFSFATEKKSNAETCRSMITKLGPDLECVTGEDHSILSNMPKVVIEGNGFSTLLDGADQVKDPSVKDPILGLAGTKHCSCCNVPFRNETYPNLLSQFKWIGDEVAEVDDPISGAVEHHRSIHRDGLKKRREKLSGLGMVSDIGNHNLDPFSHIGYSEVNITSDSESEVPLSDDDEGGAQVRKTSDLKISRVQPESGSVDTGILFKTLSTDDSIQEKLIHPTPVPESSLVVLHEQLHVGETHEASSQASAVAGSVDPDTLLESLSIDLTQEKHIHQTPVSERLLQVSHAQLLVGEPQETSSLASAVAAGNGLEGLNWDPIERENPPATSEPMSHELSSSAPLEEAPVVVSEHNLDDTEIDKMAHVSCTESVENIKLENESPSVGSQLKTHQIVTEPALQMPNSMDLNDAYKLAVGIRGSFSSSDVTEPPTGKDSSRVHDDFKLLISQISAARGFDLLWNDTSPTVHAQGDDSKTLESSSSIGVQILQKRPSRNESVFESWDGILQKRLSRNESGFESLDGSIVSEIEGESAVDRLKRQIEKDRKYMSTLYKELEEERNASTIAANQAMAMINKLQEEKSMMQMEALQYQRMMDEQAEYDQEAIQKLNELLSQREKEIQDLEAEIENYRRSFGNESMVEKIMESTTDVNGGDMRIDSSPLQSKISCQENNTNFASRRSDGNSYSKETDMMHGNYEWDEIGILKDSLLDYEDERLYISKCLKMLEKKLHLFSNNGIYINNYRLAVNGDGLADTKFEDIVFQKFNEERGTQDDVARGAFIQEDALGGNDMDQIYLNEKAEDISTENDSPTFGVGTPKSRRHAQIMAKENHSENLSSASFEYAGTQSCVADLVAIGDEFSHLKKRLETLEADRNFLEHTINSLRNGNEGMQLVQEIASHLRELRRIGIQRRDQVVA